MFASLSENSLKQYGSALKRWTCFCNINNVDIYEASIPNIIYFLTEVFNTGASYGTLNSYRSALSLVLGSKISSDDRISRLFKGFYRLRPPLPKYDITWSPTLVLEFLSNFYPNNEIHIEHLTKKTVTILALATAHRVQTLQKINVNNIEVHSNHMLVKIPNLIKTSRLGTTQPCLNIPFFRQRPEICPADSLLAYVNMTKTIRSHDQLFISFKKPFKAVTSQTISRWIKETLSESGIDTSMFSAHSTRHAATSTALRSGVSIDLIRKTAGWSGSSKVFAKFYNREIVSEDTNEFAISILEK